MSLCHCRTGFLPPVPCGLMREWGCVDCVRGCVCVSYLSTCPHRRRPEEYDLHGRKRPRTDGPPDFNQRAGCFPQNASSMIKSCTSVFEQYVVRWEESLGNCRLLKRTRCFFVTPNTSSVPKSVFFNVLFFFFLLSFSLFSDVLWLNPKLVV